MLTHIFQIEVFEALVSTRMKKNHDKHDLRITHAIELVTMFSALLRFGKHVFFIFCKFFADINRLTNNKF